MSNIYGEPLVPCRNQEGDRRGSWDADGFCSDRGASDPGVHQICFQLTPERSSFSSDTFQSEWSNERVGKNHCMCLGAWSLYKERQRRGDIPQTENDLVCEAIPESALTEKYISNWKRWNGHEGRYDLDETYVHALEKLHTQCSRDAPNEEAREHLDGLYRALRS